MHETVNRYPRIPWSNSRGFTLVELVVVIIVVSILAVGVPTFIGQTVSTYVETTERQASFLNGKMAIERISRELRAALPVSVRVSADNLCLEYLPIVAASRYLTLTSPDSPTALEVADFNLTLSAGTNYYAVTYPINTSDVFDVNSNTIAPIDTIIDADPSDGQVTVNLTLATLYQHSPGRRFFVVSDPISYCALGAPSGLLNRYTGYGLSATQPTTFAVSGSALLSELQVNNGGPIAVFDHLPGTQHRNSIVQLRFDLLSRNENLRLDHEIHIRNAP